MSEQFAYLELGAPQTVRVAWADLVCREAAADLGIAPPRVRLFATGVAPRGWDRRTWTDDRQLHGEFRASAPGEVWVRHDLDRDQMAEAVAHEVAHAAWHARYGSPWPSERSYATELAADELAAQSFASHFVRRLTRRYKA